MALNCEGTGTCTSDGSSGREKTLVLNVYDELFEAEEFTTGVANGNLRGLIRSTEAVCSRSFAKGSSAIIDDELEIYLDFGRKPRDGGKEAIPWNNLIFIILNCICYILRIIKSKECAFIQIRVEYEYLATEVKKEMKLNKSISEFCNVLHIMRKKF